MALVIDIWKNNDPPAPDETPSCLLRQATRAFFSVLLLKLLKNRLQKAPKVGRNRCCSEGSDRWICICPLNDVTLVGGPSCFICKDGYNPRLRNRANRVERIVDSKKSCPTASKLGSEIRLHSASVKPR